MIKKFTERKATGIIAAVFIILIASVMGLVVASLLGTDVGSSLNYMYSRQAFFVAEAGMECAIGKLKNDAVYRANPTTIQQAFGSGSFSVTVSKNAETYTLTSTGTVAVAVRKVTESVVLTSAVLSRGIHADGANLDFSGSSGTVNGNISCHVQVSNYENMTINGTITAPMQKINPSLDYAYYKTLAQGQGKYYTANLTFANGTYSGVYYTTKKATIGDNAIINGTIITEGSIEFANRANNVRISPTNNYPALATMGSIQSSDIGPPSTRVGLHNSTINGLILAGSNITFDYMKNNPGEDTVFNGTILADNNIQMKDGTQFTINYNPNIFIPMTPGFTYTAGDMAALPQGDWDEIY